MVKFEPLKALEKFWGYRKFRPLQREAVDTILSGRDTMVIMPTGGGKSICYQLPAVCGIGLTLVISPLIALMDDQVCGAREAGINAGTLHSQTSESERRRVFAQLHEKKIDLLYISPEKLVGGQLNDLIKNQVGLFAVDEAHCVSHWGHEFRPEYRQLGKIFSELPDSVVRLGLTATATPQVQDDICSQLGLRNPEKLIGHPDRPNLVYRSFPRFDQSHQVLEIIRRHRNEGGIVYAQTRREVERLAKTLAKSGVSCAPYHAGLSAQQRAKAQADFVHERLDVIVATIAFGMGINRSNVRYVVHANTPRSIEHYQQESGRAGRDGEPAECVLLFSAADLQMHRILALRDENVSDIRRRAIERQLSEIGRFAISPVCRHKLLAEHFGHPYPENQQYDAIGPGCRACDICLDETRALPDDEAHLTAQKIISAAFRTEGRFGAAYVAHVLIGHESPRIIDNGHNHLKVFGILKDSSEKAVRGWIDQLIVQGSLAVTEGEYPMLRHTAEGLKVCRGEARVRLGHPVAKPIAAKTRRKKAPAENLENPTLFENLRKLRLLLARRLGLPPYMIFADSVLMSLATIKPEKLDELCEIKGIGENKRDRYGEAFLSVIAGSPPEEAAERFKE